MMRLMRPFHFGSLVCSSIPVLMAMTCAMPVHSSDMQTISKTNLMILLPVSYPTTSKYGVALL